MSVELLFMFKIILKYSIIIENMRYGKANKLEMVPIETIVYFSQFLRESSQVTGGNMGEH